MKTRFHGTWKDDGPLRAAAKLSWPVLDALYGGYRTLLMNSRFCGERRWRRTSCRPSNNRQLTVAGKAGAQRGDNRRVPAS